MQEWQPIEDAWEERDGDETLLLYVPGLGVTVGHLSAGEFVIDVLNGCHETYATHWMPLPEPPNLEPAQAAGSPHSCSPTNAS